MTLTNKENRRVVKPAKTTLPTFAHTMGTIHHSLPNYGCNHTIERYIVS
jgi:hypothetical protein